jgi:hypothetical protein
MSSKAMSKWTIELFICMIIVVAGTIAILIILPGFFIPKICPKAQEEEILKVENKVKEIKGRPGYEVVYFEVKKECVKYVRYDSSSKNLKVQYTTTGEEVAYSTGFVWNIAQDPEGKLYPGYHPLKVYEDKVELGG